MTVGEAIKKLQQFDSETILLVDGEGGELPWNIDDIEQREDPDYGTATVIQL